MTTVDRYHSQRASRLLDFRKLTAAFTRVCFVCSFETSLRSANDCQNLNSLKTNPHQTVENQVTTKEN